MKKVLLPSLSLILISGCSSGLSPQEKRNNFDSCVIEYKAQHPGQVLVDPVKDVELRQMTAENFCVKFLK